MKNESRYIPEGSQEIKQDGVDAVVYAGPGLRAHGYKGKSNKPYFRYRFQSQEQMNQHISGFFKIVKESQDIKSARRLAKKDYKTSLVIGDILYSSWGHEQTNIDFYQVVKVTPSMKSVVIRSLKTTDYSDGPLTMTGKKIPVPNEFDGAEMQKKVSPGGSGLGEYISLSSYASAWKWDGKPKSYSSYA